MLSNTKVSCGKVNIYSSRNSLYIKFFRASLSLDRETIWLYQILTIHIKWSSSKLNVLQYFIRFYIEHNPIPITMLHSVQCYLAFKGMMLLVMKCVCLPVSGVQWLSSPASPYMGRGRGLMPACRGSLFCRLQTWATVTQH